MDCILFLDIDGVLNSEKFYNSTRGKEGDIDTHCVELLNGLKDEIPDLKIVISSTYGDDGKTLLEGYLDIPIVGCTTHYSFNHDWICKGNEIIEWLRKNGYNATVYPTLDNDDTFRYVIIDDNDDILKCQECHLVQIDSRIGLSESDIEKIKNILIEKDE